MKEKIKILIAVYVLVMILAFIFVNTKIHKSEKHLSILSAFQSLEYHDARLSHLVLSARYQLFHNYSPIDSTVSMLKNAISMLESNGVDVKLAGFKDKNISSANLADIFIDKSTLVEDFKTDNALIKNSLGNLPHSVGEFMEDIKSRKLKADIGLEELLHHVLSYNLTRNENDKSVLLLKIDNIKKYEKQIDKDLIQHLNSMLKHARIIVSKRGELDRQVETLTSNVLRDAASLIQGRYLERYKQDIIVSSYYRNLLFAFSVGLLVFMVWVMFRLQNTANELQKQKERAQVTLHSIGDAVITTDVNGAVTYMNPVAAELTGWCNVSSKGKSSTEVFRVVNAFSRMPVVDPVLNCIDLNRTVVVPGDSMLLHKNGEEFSIEVSAAPIRDGTGRIIGAIIVFRDISEKKQLSEKLDWHSTHDPLTGLCNLKSFESKLNYAINKAREDESKYTLLFIDLDQFKLINDTCGHIAGDELLQQVTSLIAQTLKSNYLLARLGGDEFGVLLNEPSMQKAIETAKMLLDSLKELRFEWNNNVFQAGASIGLAVVSSGNTTSSEVLKYARSACFVAKDKGRNSIHVYEHDNEVIMREIEMQWISDITRSLEENRFTLYKQLIMPTDSADTSHHHFEVLIRMLDDKGNIILPGSFIPAAELYGMMSTIDKWIISKFFSSDNGISIDKSATYAINLSGQSMSNEEFLYFVIEKIESSDINPENICFEITETAAIANLTGAIRFINTLKTMGCKFSLDDFGMGMSSFGYLKTMPVDYLKIDGSFIKDMIRDPMVMAMVSAINDIGHVVGLKTIAEYVETSVVQDKLKEMGVDYVQGYYISKPEPFDVI